MRALLSLAALLAASAAGAQTQAAMNAEAATVFQRADGELNRQYGATMAQMRSRDARTKWRSSAFGYAKALLASQRAWLAFRDAECVIESGEFGGGSAQAMAMAQCKARLTTERTAQLRRLEWRK